MTLYNISKSFTWNSKITAKVTSVCKMFGLSVERLKSAKLVLADCQIDIRPGDIVYITGPSGCGKSILLNELEKAVPPQDRINLAQILLPADKTVIDCISPPFCFAKRSGGDGGELLDSLRLLSTAGLNDVFCILNQPCNLSDGEKYRFRLAMALAAGKKYVFADEFCSELDRICAASVSFRLRQFAPVSSVACCLDLRRETQRQEDRNEGTTFILASSHEDILLDLAPDVLVRRDLSGSTNVVYKDSARSA
jgi:ABC-type ATPase with predicted acetyltransferase domain